jgi:hypothetical protein
VELNSLPRIVSKKCRPKVVPGSFQQSRCKMLIDYDISRRSRRVSAVMPLFPSEVDKIRMTFRKLLGPRCYKMTLIPMSDIPSSSKSSICHPAVARKRPPV